MNYYSALKKNEIMSFAAIGIDLEIIILRSQKNKYHMISLLCRNLKYDTKELLCETETHAQTENTPVVAKGEDGWIVSLSLVDANCVYQSLSGV